MSFIVKHKQFIASALLMWILLYIIYPHYQYFVDPDGTSYLTISARYAAGDFQKAVNAFWSPWSCWLTALVIGTGLAPIPSSVIVNVAGATGFLFIAHSLFFRFRLSEMTRWLFCGSLVVFLCFAVFWQTFDDIWQAFFLLAAFRVLLSAGFVEKPLMWIVYGMLGCLAYFAKAYGLPFFVLNTAVGVWILSGRNRSDWAKIVFVTVAVMLLCAFPWLYALRLKYGTWMASSTGGLNMSWFLVGHHYFTESVDILLKPLYADSVYYWEDPYVVNGPAVHFWDSWHFFGRLILRFGYNFIKLAISLAQLSIFAPLVALYVFFRVIIIKRFLLLGKELQLLCLTLMLFPSGYLLVHFESRYLWYMLPPAMVVVGLLLQDHSLKTAVFRRFALFAFSLSIIVFPLMQLKSLYNDGREEYDFAMKMKAANLSGVDMVSNLHPRVASKVCYFSGNRYYCFSRHLPHTKDKGLSENKGENTLRLLSDIKKYGIKYYLYAPQQSGKMKSPAFYDNFYENLFDSTGSISFRPLIYDEVSGMTLYVLH